jgi:LAO/AO transport system kinase
MESVALDPGVFIRSMATRGSLGGLAAATREVADVLDGFGFDRIIIETVGVGQSELDIARLADTSVVALVPESGDSIQTLKAGLMEIADIFVINKADRPGADRLKHEVELMLGLRMGHAFRSIPAHHGVEMRSANPARMAREGAAVEADRWTPPVLPAIAVKSEGIPDLIGAIDRHFAYLDRSGELRARRRQRLRERVVEVVEDRVRARLWRDDATNAWIEERLPELESGTLTPFAAADALLQRSGDLLTRGRR